VRAARSELDLVGCDGYTVCFIEVKTGTAHDVQPAEAVVDFTKRRDVSDIAREFLRKVKGNPPLRFVVVSMYLDSTPSEIELFKNAFSLA
jgi:putative endonuclease